MRRTSSMERGKGGGASVNGKKGELVQPKTDICCSFASSSNRWAEWEIERELPRPKRWPDVIWAIWKEKLNTRYFDAAHDYLVLRSFVETITGSYSTMKNHLEAQEIQKKKPFREIIKCGYLIPTVLEELLFDLEESLRCQEGVRAGLELIKWINNLKVRKTITQVRIKCISPDTREAIDDFEIMRTPLHSSMCKCPIRHTVGCGDKHIANLLLQSAPDGSRTNHLTISKQML